MSSTGASVPNGGADAPEKIVLIHPMGWGTDFWQPVLDTADGSAVLDPVTLPGPLPGGGDFTIDAAIERIDEAVERAGDPVVLAGVSLGARLAVHYAARRTEGISRLVISGTGLGSGSALQGFVYRFVPASVVTAMSPNNTRAAGLQQLAALRELDTADDLARLSVPVTLVCAADDREYLPQSRRAAEIVGRPLIEVDHGGHFWPNKRPRLFLDIVEEGSGS